MLTHSPAGTAVFVRNYDNEDAEGRVQNASVFAAVDAQRQRGVVAVGSWTTCSSGRLAQYDGQAERRRGRPPHLPPAHRSGLAPLMATTSKQYKAIGEDIWKGRTEKVVRILPLYQLSSSRVQFM